MVFVPSQGRDYKHQSCAVVSSGYATLFLLCSSACGLCVLLVISDLFLLAGLVAARGGRRVAAFRPSVRRGVPRALGCCVCVRFLLGGPVPGSFAGSRRRHGWSQVLCWPSSCSSFLWFVLEDLVYGVFVGFGVVWFFCRFSGILRVAGCPPSDLWQVSKRICRKWISILAGSLGVFFGIRSSRSRRLLRGGGLHGLRRAVEPLDPERTSPSEGRWKRGKWCEGVCGFAVGTCRQIRSGVRCSASLCQGTQTRLSPTRETETTCTKTHTHTERATPQCKHARCLRTQHTHARGLLGS